MLLVIALAVVAPVFATPATPPAAPAAAAPTSTTPAAPKLVTLEEARRLPRVEVDVGADGTVVLDGRAFPAPPRQGGSPEIEEAARAALAARPGAVAWLRVPPTLPTGKVVAVLGHFGDAVAAVIEAPGLPPLVVPRAAYDMLTTIAAPLGSEPVRPPITVHLRADGVWAGRTVEAGLHARLTGPARLAWAEGVLAADGALHPGRALVIVDVDDTEPVGDAIAVGKLVGDTGGGAIVLAAGAARVTTPTPATPPRPTGPVERVPGVDVTDDGTLFLRDDADALTRLPHDRVDHFEAFCDATLCDLVLATTDGRRIGMGTRERAVPVPDWILERPVHTYEGRLGLPATPRSGVLSPVVKIPGAEPTLAAGSTPAAPSGGVVATGGEPTRLGKLDKADIDAVIKKEMKHVRACWVEAQRRVPAGGKVVVKFTIGAAGAVTDAGIKSTEIPDERFQACVVETFRTFAFPAPEGGGIVIVSYPFVFAH